MSIPRIIKAPAVARVLRREMASLAGWDNPKLVAPNSRLQPPPPRSDPGSPGFDPATQKPALGLSGEEIEQAVENAAVKILVQDIVRKEYVFQSDDLSVVCYLA